MKIQLNTTDKTIKVEENVELKELVNHLEKLLPKGSPFGYWKDYKLKTNTTIYNWTNPIVIQPNYIQPFYVPYNQPQVWPGTTINCESPNTISFTGKQLLTEVGVGGVGIVNCNMSNIIATNSTSNKVEGIYNIQLN